VYTTEGGGFVKGEEFAVWARGREVCAFIVEREGSNRVRVRGEGMFLGIVFIEKIYNEQEKEDLAPSVTESLEDVREGKDHRLLYYHGNIGGKGYKGVTRRRRTGGGVDYSYIAMSGKELSLVCFTGRKLVACVHSTRMQG
jgi:hypothetical protein